MGEEPKNFWKKSLTKNPLVFSLLVAVAGASVIVIIGTVCGMVKENWKIAGVWVGFTLFIGMAFTAIRWLCNWKNFRRFLFGFACIATVTGLLYAEENWRGKRAWENYKTEWEVKGEKYDFADFIPPTVPDEQNFAMQPIWVESMKAQLGPKNSIQWFGTNYAENGRTNFIGWLDNFKIYYDETANKPVLGDWQRGTLTVLKDWQTYYRESGLTNRAKDLTWPDYYPHNQLFTNLFPVAPEPQTAPQDVLLALSKYDGVLTQLQNISGLPYARFPLNYDDEDPAEILLPHLASLKRGAEVLQLRAIAELQNGESDKAFDDIKLSLRLVDVIRTEPFIITHLVRIAMLDMALQPLYEGLAEHKWSDAQLSVLDAELGKLDFLADYERSTKSELAAHTKMIDWMEERRSRFWSLYGMFFSDEKKEMNNFWIASEIYLMPRGWFYQSDIVMAEVHRHEMEPMVDDANQTVSPELAHESTAVVGALKHTAVNLFARLLLPELGKYAMHVAWAQTAANEARIAIALERYRLAHGSFPDSLDALTPQYLEKISHDIIGGQPLKYTHKADGTFVLYSIGWNETDDGGVIGYKTKPASGSYMDWESATGPKPAIDLEEGDWVWEYPQK